MSSKIPKKFSIQIIILLCLMVNIPKIITKQERINPNDKYIPNIDNDKIDNNNNEKIIFVTIQHSDAKTYTHHFKTVKSYLEKKYPKLHIIGEIYPLSFFRKFLSMVVTFIEFSIIGFIISGDFINDSLKNYIPEKCFEIFKKGKIAKGAIVYFISGLINSYITDTKAFEVIYKGNLIFSSLKLKGKVINEFGIVRLLRENGANF